MVSRSTSSSSGSFSPSKTIVTSWKAIWGSRPPANLRLEFQNEVSQRPRCHEFNLHTAACIYIDKGRQYGMILTISWALGTSTFDPYSASFKILLTPSAIISELSWMYPSQAQPLASKKPPLTIFSQKNQFTLLRVIPTMTFQDVDFDIYFTFTYILYIYSDNLSDIYSDILSGKYSGILSDICSGILFDIYSDILSGILSDIYSDILSGILSDIYSDMVSG